MIFEAGAKAFDRVSRAASTEFQRKTRTLAGNYQLVRLEPRLLLPFVNPVWVQFLSHKLARLFVPYALCAIFITSGMLAAQHVLFSVVFACQLIFYGLGVYGAILERRDRVDPQRASFHA